MHISHLFSVDLLFYNSATEYLSSKHSMLCDYCWWIFTRYWPRGQIAGPICRWCCVRCACKYVRCTQCHLHQEGASSCGQQPMALTAVQQRQCAGPSCAAVCAVRWGRCPKGVWVLDHSVVLCPPGDSRNIWGGNWVRIGSADQSYQSPHTQHQWHCEGLCPDHTGSGGVSWREEPAVVDQ